MAKRRSKKIRTIIGIVATLLLLSVVVALMANFDTIFGDKTDDGNVPGNDGDTSSDNLREGIFKVYFGETELTPGEVIQSTKSTTSLMIESSEDYVASFVTAPGYKSFRYELGDDRYVFNPDVNVLNTEIKDNVATIEFPYDIMEWVLLRHPDATMEQVTLPTDFNYNIPFVAFKVIVSKVEYYYPIKFDLNGVWTKVYLDKDEIVFCD